MLRASSSSFSIPDEAPPSRLRGSGQKEEVKLRGGVCRFCKGGGASGFEASERRPGGVVQFGGTVGFEARRRRKSGEKLRGRR